MVRIFRNLFGSSPREGSTDRQDARQLRDTSPTGARRVRTSRSTPIYIEAAKNEQALYRFIPFSSMIGAHDVKMVSGDYLRVWRLGGVSFETNDQKWIQERHDAMCSVFRNLAGGEFAIYTHRVHRLIQDELSAITAPAVAKQYDAAYRQKLGTRSFMANELYLSVLYRPRRRVKATTAEQVSEEQAEALRVFEEKTQMINRTLREFDAQLLGEYEIDGLTYNEVAEFLGFLVNGKWCRVRTPKGPLNAILPKARMFFGGDKIEIRSPEESRFVAMVDIKEYAPTVEPGVLNILLYEDCEFIETQSFAMLPLKKALAALKLQRDQLIASEDVVQTQIEAMDLALNNVGDGMYSMGEYHYSLAVFGKDVKEAGKKAARCIGAIGELAGIEMAAVDLVSDAAWFAQLPGNFQWRTRSAKITSRAFAALASQHNFYMGKRDGNPWGPAVAIMRTPAGQPYYFNFHVSPDKQDSESKKLPGNMAILGTTGAGKTTLEMALLYSTRRFDPVPCLFVFDYNRGAEIALRAIGGQYYSIELGKPTGCSPLQREPTPRRIQFWQALVRQCIESPQLPLMPKDEADIAAAVLTVSRFPREKRSFSSIQENLPKGGENSLYHRLARWCKGGALGWVFDEADDMLLSIKDVSVVGFDYTQFIDNPEVRAPMLMYLMDVLREVIDGRRIIVMFAEFWKALEDPWVSDIAKELEKTIRKMNGLIIGETQSPADVLTSDIGRTVVEQSVTKVFMQNAEAQHDDYVNGFGLSEAEFEIVKTLGSTGRREFLVKQGHRSAICELDLSGLDDEITLLSGSTDNVALLDDIRAEVGDDPADWVPVLLERSAARDRASKFNQRSSGNKAARG